MSGARLAVVFFTLLAGAAGCGGGGGTDRDRVREMARAELDCSMRDRGPRDPGPQDRRPREAPLDPLDVHEERMHHWIAICGDRSVRYVCRGLRCERDRPRQVETATWASAGALECRASGRDVALASTPIAAVAVASADVVACGVPGVVIDANGENGWLYVATMPAGSTEAQRRCVAAALAQSHVVPPLGISITLACRTRGGGAGDDR